MSLLRSEADVTDQPMKPGDRNDELPAGLPTLAPDATPHYRPTIALRRFIEARDITCRAPGCRRPARHCDIDHILPRSQRGATAPDNLVTLCRRHHRAKHLGGHRVRLTLAGVEWTTPRGHTYLTPPASILTTPPLPIRRPRQ